jgi:hypothetical protein
MLALRFGEVLARVCSAVADARNAGRVVGVGGMNDGVWPAFLRVDWAVMICRSVDL